MSTLIPRHLVPRRIPHHRVPHVAAWLAAAGHDLLTAPPSLLTLALEEPWGPRDQYDVGDGPPRDEDTYSLELI